MAKWKKIALGITATIGVLAGILVLGGYWFFSGMCGADQYISLISPNGKYKAVIFQFDCGATTGFSTQVSILKINENLSNNPGNVYTSKGHPEYVAPVLTWVSDEHLNIKNIAKTQTYKQKESWGWLLNKIKVTYN
jgi:hypothetical protein